MGTRESTTDIDAMWNIGSDMREAINAVGDKLGLSHKWCNCDFKKTKSFTNSIIVESKIYKEFDRLVVWMVKPELLLAMKLVAFREHKPTDASDCLDLIAMAKRNGIVVNRSYLYNLVIKYYGSIDILSNYAKNFINGY